MPRNPERHPEHDGRRLRRSATETSDRALTRRRVAGLPDEHDRRPRWAATTRPTTRVTRLRPGPPCIAWRIIDLPTPRPRGLGADVGARPRGLLEERPAWRPTPPTGARSRDPELCKEVSCTVRRPAAARGQPRPPAAAPRAVRGCARIPGRPRGTPYAGAAHEPTLAAMTVYLDHAATTPMLPAAVEAMTTHLADVGNASSLHASGPARAPGRGGVARDRSPRRSAADPARWSSPPAAPRPTTSRSRASSGPAATPTRAGPASSPPRSSTTPSSTRSTGSPSTRAPRWSCCPSTQRGRLDVDGAARARSSATPTSVALVSVMWANNEVGTLQPVDEVVAIAAAHGIPVHTDAVQAVGAVPVDFAASGVDALTLTGHKLGGPYGVGALVVRREVDGDRRSAHGGGQERDIRSGTLDTPAIAGVRRRRRAVGQGAARARRPAGRRCATTWSAGSSRSSPTPTCTARRRGSRAAARQRPPRLPRLRGRLAADAARRPRHRVLDRLRLLGRRAAALPRAARDGLRRGAGAPLAAVHLRPHLARPPTSTRWSRRSARSSSGATGRSARSLA